MSQRAHRSALERHARSRLAQPIAREPCLRGALVERARPCGTPTCRCQRGQLHRSLYLATRHQGRRALLSIPRALEENVRQWLPNGRRRQQAGPLWPDGRRTVPYGDADGLRTAEGVGQPLRVVPAVETVRRRERVAGPWREKEETSSWYWAATLSGRHLSTRRVWQAGHGRGDVENGCCNTLSLHWGLDHCFKHDPAAIVPLVLTLFLAYVLLPCFWQRNVPAPLRKRIGTLLGLAEELRRSLDRAVRAPWYKQLARAP
jgi:hypothetical protein